MSSDNNGEYPKKKPLNEEEIYGKVKKEKIEWVREKIGRNWSKTRRNEKTNWRKEPNSRRNQEIKRTREKIIMILYNKTKLNKHLINLNNKTFD